MELCFRRGSPLACGVMGIACCSSIDMKFTSIMMTIMGHFQSGQQKVKQDGLFHRSDLTQSVTSCAGLTVFATPSKTLCVG